MRTLAAVLAAGLGMAGHAHPGRGIVVDRAGGVFVADAVRSVVWQLAPDGRMLAAAREVHAHWLAIEPDGALLADHVQYDAATRQFLRGLVRIEGSISVAAIIEPRPDPDGLDAGAFAVQGDSLYIARDSTATIEVRRDGCTTRTLALPAATATVNSLGVDARGRIVAVRGREVLSIDAGRAAEIIFTAPITSQERVLGLRDLWGLALGTDGTIYTTDPGLRRVIAIDPSGGSRALHDVEAPWFPTGVALREACLLVLEHGLAEDLNLGPRVSCVAEGGPARVLGRVVDERPQAQ